MVSDSIVIVGCDYGQKIAYVLPLRKKTNLSRFPQDHFSTKIFIDRYCVFSYICSKEKQFGVCVFYTYN